MPIVEDERRHTRRSLRTLRDLSTAPWLSRNIRNSLQCSNYTTSSRVDRRQRGKRDKDGRLHARRRKRNNGRSRNDTARFTLPIVEEETSTRRKERDTGTREGAYEPRAHRLSSSRTDEYRARSRPTRLRVVAALTLALNLWAPRGGGRDARGGQTCACGRERRSGGTQLRAGETWIRRGSRGRTEREGGREAEGLFDVVGRRLRHLAQA